MVAASDIHHVLYKHTQLRVLAAIQFCHIVDVMVFVAIGPYLVADLGLTAGHLGWLVSAYALAAALAGLVAAAIIDRYPRKLTLTATSFVFAFAMGICAVAGNLWVLLIARVLAGVGAGILPGAVHAALGEHVLDEHRGKAIGTVQSAFAAAAVAGLPLLLVVANLTHWRFAFACVALGTGAAATAALFLLPSSTPCPPGAHISPLERVHLSISRKPLLVLLFIAVTAFPSMMVVPYIAVYLVENVGVSKTDLPFVYLCGGAVLLLCARSIGRWTDQHGRVSVFRLFALASIVPLALVTQIGPTPLLTVLGLAMLYFLLVPGRMIPAMAIVTSAAPHHARGTFLSLVGVAQQAGGAIAAALGASLVTTSSFGSIAGFDRCGYLAILASLVAAVMAGMICFVPRAPETPSLESPSR